MLDGMTAAGENRAPTARPRGDAVLQHQQELL